MSLFNVKKISKTIKKEILLLTIIVLAIFLRVWHIWGWPLNIAEASYAVQASEIINWQNFYFVQTVYSGPFPIYFFIPSIFFFGNNILFLRLSVVLVDIGSILLIYLFTKKYYNEKVAFLAAFILTITPNEILDSSVAFENPLIPFFIVLSLYMFLKYAETKRSQYLYITSFVFGIATITRLTFVFFILAFLVTLKFQPIFPFDELKRRFKRKDIFFILFFFLIGSSPMIYWNLVNNFATASFIFSSFPISKAGVNLLNVKGNLLNGFHNFITFLDYEQKYAIDVPLKNIQNHYFSIIFFSSLAVLAIASMTKNNSTKNDSYKIKMKNFYLIIIFFILFLFTSTLTVSPVDQFKTADYLALFPFYSIIIAWSIIFVLDFIKNKKALFWFTFAFLFIIFMVEIFFFFVNQEKIFEIQNSYSCNKILPGLINSSVIKKSQNVIFDSSRYYFYYRFYEPKKNSTALIFPDTTQGIFSGISQVTYKKWPDILNLSNPVFIFIKKDCNAEWLTIDAYERFKEFIVPYNKTLILKEEIIFDNEKLAQIYGFS